MTRIRPEIEQTLIRFRRWIRRYIFFEGLAVLTALACGLFWLTFVVDVAWFRFSHLELPASFRLLSVLLGTLLLAGVLMVWLVSRLLRTFRARDLALALERRFPQLNDRLITAVEMGSSGGSEIQNRMLSHTADDVVTTLTQLPIEDSFNAAPLRRSVIVAGTLLCTILVLGLTHAEGMERWYNAYILGKDDYWEPFRKNSLRVRVMAQPGDRIRDFNESLIYKHPKGADLQLIAEAAEGTIPPENAVLRFIGIGGSRQDRGRVTMSRIGDAEFRHTLARVVNDQHLWIRAGDFVNRQPLRVQVVDPPKIDSIELNCDYPEYMGMEALEDRPIKVVGTLVPLPMETQFEVAATSNKPLTRVHLSGVDFSLSFGFERHGAGLTPLPTRLTLRGDGEEGRVLEIPITPASLFNKERTAFKVPFLVTADAARRRGDDEQSRQFPIAIPADTLLQMSLEDDDMISSQEPASLAIRGVVDEAPVVDTRRTGIGTVVTRMARIPVEGRITDDYGIAEAWFGYRIGRESEADGKRPLASLPAGRKSMELESLPDQRFEYFDLIPLKLEEGQTLVLTVHARDGDDINGPHESHGELLSFKIVSKDELLARLYDREINLRLRFEQIRAEVGGLKSDLEGIREQIAQLASEPVRESPAAVLTSAFVERALHQVRKNHTESRSIEVSFRDLRGEMVNNRVDTVEMLQRIEQGVISPLAGLNANEFLAVDREFGAFRLTLQRQSGIAEAYAPLAPAIDRLLARMDAILAEMKDRGSYNDLIQSLQGIIERQKQLLNKTEDKRIEENFFSPLK